MHTNIKQRRHTLIVITMIVCFVSLGGCRQAHSPTLTLSPTFQPGPTSAELPRFLSYIHPRPEELVIQAALSISHAWATLELEEIAEPGDTLGLEEMQSKVEFLMDGKPLDAQVVRGFIPDRAQVQIIGTFPLDLGQHEATIRVHRTSGDVLEYSWTFTVVAEEPTLPGLPEGFQFVRPLPDSIITLQAYREEHLVPPYHSPAFADLRGGVCVGVLPGKIVEPGEFLDGSDVARKYSLVTLDDISLDTNTVTVLEYEPLEIRVFDEVTGRMVASYVGPHNYKCWRVELSPGVHNATVQLQKASGEAIEYTWQFTITSD